MKDFTVEEINGYLAELSYTTSHEEDAAAKAKLNELVSKWDLKDWPGFAVTK